MRPENICMGWFDCVRTYVCTYLCSFRHSFHKACIDRWLTDKRTCPLCKQDIVGDLKGKVSAWLNCSYIRMYGKMLFCPCANSY